MLNKSQRTLICSALVSVSLAMLTGCEWDNSEDYQNDPAFNGDSPGENTGTPGTGTDKPSKPDPSSPVISGTVATTESVVKAVVCLDQNGNSVCDQGEPQTRSDEQGEWAIALPDGQPLSGPVSVVAQAHPPETSLADSGEQVTWKYSLIGRATPDISGSVTGMFISPLSTLVETERQSLPGKNQDKAIDNVAAKLGTDADILENYLNPPAGTSPVEDQDYQRLERIASIVDGLAQEIDSSITDDERSNLSPDELNKRIFDQIDDAIPDIVDDVNRSFVESLPGDEFIPDEVIQSPKYEDTRQPPSTEPPSASLTELERRIANAKLGSPFFIRSGFETLPVAGAALYDFEFFPNRYRHGQVYYEARARVTESTSGDQAVTEIEGAEAGRLKPSHLLTTYKVITERDCYEKRFDCDKLWTRPLRARGLVWTGFSFQEETLQIGHQGTQRLVSVDTLGDLITSSTRNGFSTQLTYRELTLEGLDGRDVLKNFTHTTLPGTATWTFGPGALAYTVSEKLNANVFLSQWPQGGVGNLCEAPGLPDASITGSCNLVYGAHSQSTGEPVKTFNDLLYPPAQRNSVYAGVLEDGEPTDAIRVSGPTNDVFVARLVGSAGGESGTIILDRKTGTGWTMLPLVGHWERKTIPFPRIDLRLPDGFAYTGARLGFKLGHAYLFERQGYLRNGWMIPKEVNLDSLFNRRQVQFAFSQEAFDQMIDAMEATDLLVEHPYYSILIDDIGYDGR